MVSRIPRLEDWLLSLSYGSPSSSVSTASSAIFASIQRIHGDPVFLGLDFVWPFNLLTTYYRHGGEETPPELQFGYQRLAVFAPPFLPYGGIRRNRKHYGSLPVYHGDKAHMIPLYGSNRSLDCPVQSGECFIKSPSWVSLSWHTKMISEQSDRLLLTKFLNSSAM